MSIVECAVRALFMLIADPICLGPSRFRCAPISMGFLMIGMGVYPLSPLGTLLFVGDDDGRAKYASADVWIFLDGQMIRVLRG